MTKRQNFGLFDQSDVLVDQNDVLVAQNVVLVDQKDVLRFRPFLSTVSVAPISKY